jgi:cell division septal protein FtsQ
MVILMSKYLKILPIFCALGIIAFSAQKSPEYWRRWEFLRVREFLVVGNQYLANEVIWEIASFPVNTSVLDDLARTKLLLEEHEMILEASVKKKWWSRKVVLTIEEKIPLALLANALLVPVDRDGNTLPLDPGQHLLDLPLLRVEGDLGERSEEIRTIAMELERLIDNNSFFANELSEISIDGEGNAEAILNGDIVVRFRPPLANQTLRAGLTALEDAKKRRLSGVGIMIDLRFDGQVVASYGAEGRQ